MSSKLWPDEKDLVSQILSEAAERQLQINAKGSLWWLWDSAMGRRPPAAILAARLSPWGELPREGSWVVLPLAAHQNTLIIALHPATDGDVAWSVSWEAYNER